VASLEAIGKFAAMLKEMKIRSGGRRERAQRIQQRRY
jgi:hypothetical protein